MENTIENKAKFFALYWGQEVVKDSLNNSDKCSVEFSLSEGIHIEGYLELTPLSQISDEDAAEIAMLLVQWNPSMSRLKPGDIIVIGRKDGDHVWDKIVLEFKGSFKYTIKYRDNDWVGWIDGNSRCEWTLWNHSQVTDYLRSKGYALPYMGLSVEKLIEYNWVKLK